MPSTLLPKWRDAIPRVLCGDANSNGHQHQLFAFTAQTESVPHVDCLRAVLQRRGQSWEAWLHKPGQFVCAELGAADSASSQLASWVCLPTSAANDVFNTLTHLRAALAPLLSEAPAHLRVQVMAADDDVQALAVLALRVALLNGIDALDKKSPRSPLQSICVSPLPTSQAVASELANAEGNALARWLTHQPANVLTPAAFRQFCEEEAQRRGWVCRVYRAAELAAMGAGCFTAVASGSEDPEACIVHLRRAATAEPQVRVALVGKGVCFDTGGYQLKSTSDMQGMHEDMGGAAVALGLMVAAHQAGLPLQIDCWLALADNKIGPRACTPQSVVRALNGSTVEIVNTDSEGRLLLADTLLLAQREDKPDVIIDFATLTGAMVAALGYRMSGTLSNTPDLQALCAQASEASGERAVMFPLASDYDDDLKSELADIRHTTLDLGGGGILAARFLQRFVGTTPWVHADLSSWRHKGGLGAVNSDLTGWGVVWGAWLLQALSRSTAQVAEATAFSKRN
jgi:leucyl aminopeptidase